MVKYWKKKNKRKKFMNKEYFHIVASAFAIFIPTITALFFLYRNYFQNKIARIDIMLMAIGFGFGISLMLLIFIPYLRSMSNKLHNFKQIFFIDGVPLQSLLIHIHNRAEMGISNSVELELLEISAQVCGDGIRKDAKMIHIFKGKNISETENLTQLNIALAGDNTIPLSELKASIIDHTNDPEGIIKNHKPNLKPNSEDATLKNLILPFAKEGIKPQQTFKIELRHYWPGVYSTTKDYFFCDNIDFDGRVNKLKMTIEFLAMQEENVRVYRINQKNGEVGVEVGALPPETDKPHLYVFEKTNPLSDVYYVIFFDGKNDYAEKSIAEEKPKRHSNLLRLVV